MPEDRPRNFLQVLTGAAGAGLETLGKAKAVEKQRALPEALSIFSAMLEAERAQEARALNRIRRKEATIDVEIKGSQLQKILKLQALGLDNPLELEKALQDIRAEGELEKTRSLMEMVEEETGVTTIPSGLKMIDGAGSPFTPYQRYQMGRTEQKDYESDVLDEANALWGQGALIIGEEAFDIKNVRDLDAALRIAEEAAFVQPSSLAPGYDELVQKLRQLRQQLGGQNGKPPDMTDAEWEEYLQLKGR